MSRANITRRQNRTLRRSPCLVGMSVRGTSRRAVLDSVLTSGVFMRTRKVSVSELKVKGAISVMLNEEIGFARVQDQRRLKYLES